MPVKDKRYPVWWNMVQRCTNEDATRYPDYGAKGIGVCDRWLDPENGFSNFCADVGPRPVGFTLDRIENTKGYSPDNCRWADFVTQNRNKDSVKIKEHDIYEILALRASGKKLREIAERFGVAVSTICVITKKREIYEARIAGNTQAAI